MCIMNSVWGQLIIQVSFFNFQVVFKNYDWIGQGGPRHKDIYIHLRKSIVASFALAYWK
ncbi:hypothetical protein CLV98_101870 [Dyadobacter jejuensis]|uniref:Uncharacterized protein n=1 Tax=Dyadobacter jejuensis TaxID=1082580 RepID=A0A316ASK7_9BACT|nr:hypothetical protein CLV98_101870 [Dyadobacter jejuensis]